MKMPKLILPEAVAPLRRLHRVLQGPTYAGCRFFIVVDSNTFTYCLPQVVEQVGALQTAEFLEVPAGEEAKELEVAAQLWATLQESGADADTVIVNLGGGAVCDLGGFVAAAYKRGIRYVNIPTTLLAMVDAAVGGKTAVNMGVVKNTVGFVHQPSVVVVEPAFLDTLPAEGLRSGLFELLKTLLLCNGTLYHSVLERIENRDLVLPPALISECVTYKQSVVRTDPNDHGVRHILNLGHTFGHAIESYHRGGAHPYTHGEAVGIGMACAMYLSVRKLAFPSQEETRYRAALQQLLPLPHYTLEDTEAILSIMRQDKKNRHGDILSVLLQAPECPVIDVALDENEIRDTLLHLG